MPVRIATYNVLATAYIRPDFYPGVPAECLDRARRVPALVRHAIALDADLLLLQEVEPDVFAALEAGLGPLGYHGGFEQKGQGRPDGCATFFRRNHFGLRTADRLDYRADASGALAQLLALQHDGRVLGVANTHLRWDPPARPAPEQVGYRQALELLAALDSFEPRCDGWVVCGDFNRTPDHAVVAAFRQAGFEFAHAGRPDLRSCVANARARLIDYVFHTRTLWSRPVDSPELSDETHLPSKEEPSDHVALVADLNWAVAL